MGIRHRMQFSDTNLKKILKKTKKGSLTREIAVIISGMVAGTILLCLLLNTVFLEPYYMKNQQRVLEDGFGVIDDASAAGALRERGI